MNEFTHIWSASTFINKFGGTCTEIQELAAVSVQMWRYPMSPNWPKPGFLMLMRACQVSETWGNQVHRKWPEGNLIMESESHLRCVWRSHFKDDGYASLAAEHNLQHTALLMNYSCQQSLTLFSLLISSITPTSPSLSTVEQQQKLSW